MTPKSVPLAHRLHYQHIQRPHIYLKVNFSSSKSTRLQLHLILHPHPYVISIVHITIIFANTIDTIPNLSSGLQIVSPSNLSFKNPTSDLSKYKFEHITLLLTTIAHLSQDEFTVH